VRSDTRRLLLLLQLIHRRPGLRLERIARTLGQSERDVLRDLERLSLCGVPPFTPDDYLDAYVERGRVYVRGAGGFKGATRLTPEEAVSLLASLRFLEESGGGRGAFPAVRSAAQKIEEALSGETRGTTQQLRRRMVWEPAAAADARTFESVRRALSEHRVLEVAYYSESADELHRGNIHPYGLVFARGNWYLIGLSETRGEVRTLRVDRIQHAQLLRTRYEMPADFDASAYVNASMMKPSGAETKVLMRVAPPLAEFAAEEYADVQQEADGTLAVTLHTSDLTWAARQALRWAPHAEILSPSEARDETSRLAADLAQRYAREATLGEDGASDRDAADGVRLATESKS
jgi:proteasome accessory factor C